jgi:hypothetical protein
MAIIGVGLATPNESYGQADVDKEIQELRDKLSQLEQQQIELKKEATAAAAAMPSFSYRPGSGMMIEAADKSWSFRHAMETHFNYQFLSGRDQVGRSQGELQGRRFRPEFYLCVNNCLWTIDWRLDLDGFGGATGLQRGMILFDAEQLNPWLPRVGFGMDTTNAGPVSRARKGSSSTAAQLEYDLFTANQGFNTGSAGSGLTLTWDDRSLSSIGIPGRIARFQAGMNAYGEGGDGNQVNTDRKDFHTYLSVEPFRETKNKWTRGMLFEYGAWFCNADGRALSNGCNRIRVRDHARGNGRQILFDTQSNTVGDGLTVQQGPGFVWSIGPYSLRSMFVTQSASDGAGNGPGSILRTNGLGTRGEKKGRAFLIGHDLYLWSPKGWFTGSANTAGSVLVGTHFERTDVSIGCNGSTGIVCTGGHLDQFHRSRILLREWDLWYFIAPRMSVGINVLWYDASNLDNSRNAAAHNLGICSSSKIAAGGCRSGVGGDWVDWFLNWRYTF